MSLSKRYLGDIRRVVGAIDGSEIRWLSECVIPRLLDEIDRLRAVDEDNEKLRDRLRLWRDAAMYGESIRVPKSKNFGDDLGLFRMIAKACALDFEGDESKGVKS